MSRRLLAIALTLAAVSPGAAHAQGALPSSTTTPGQSTDATGHSAKASEPGEQLSNDSAGKPIAADCDGQPVAAAPEPDDTRAIPAFRTTVIGRRPPPPGTRTEITAREIALRGATNLSEALAGEPSLDIHEGPKAGSTLQIRGFDERAMLVLLEGIPIREVYDGHFDIASLPAFALGFIELERGMTSLLFGPNSGGGILSLKAADRCDHLADLSLFTGNPYQGRLQRYGGAASGCHAKGPFSIKLSGSYDRSEGYVLSRDYAPNQFNASFHEDGGVRDGSEFTRASLALLAGYAPERNKKLSLFLNGVHAPRGLPVFEGTGVTRYWKFKRYDTLLLGLTGTWGPQIAPAQWGLRSARAQLYAHVHRDELNDYEDATYSALTTNTLAWFVASAYANESYGAAAQSSFSLTPGNRLDASVRYQLDRNAQREIRVGQPYATESWSKPDHFSAHVFSAAVEDSQVLGDWRVLLGAGAGGMVLDSQVLRGKEYAVDGRLLPTAEGRLVIERSLGEDWVLMAAAGRKVRLPTLKELFADNVGGNPSLRSEVAWMAETGFDYKSQALRLEASARAFFNSIEGLIQQRRDTFENLGHAVTTGAEVEVKHTPISALELSAGYRFLYARDLEAERGLDYRTPHRLRLAARCLTPWGLTAGLTGIWSAGQEAWYVDSLSGQWIHDQVDGHVLLHANVRYELAGAAAGLYLHANARNLLDANYAIGGFEPRAGREGIVGIGGRL